MKQIIRTIIIYLVHISDGNIVGVHEHNVCESSAQQGVELAGEPADTVAEQAARHPRKGLLQKVAAEELVPLVHPHLDREVGFEHAVRPYGLRSKEVTEGIRMDEWMKDE